MGILSYSLDRVILMEKKVLKNIIEYGMVETGDTILAAVSGGPDSMAMLMSLVNLRERLGFRLAIAHVNHGVRGELADRDQRFVEETAGKLNIPYHTINVDMVAHGKELGISSEEAGRLLRYDFFRKVLAGYGKGRIAVAHNMNDQAETVLFRIMRGTGIDGLKGMSFNQDDVIRPLLNITRDEIEGYIKDNGIQTVEDHTNLQTVYTRNRIRLELLPYIMENFNPNIIEGLFRMSLLATEDSTIIEDAVEKKYNSVVKNKSYNSIIFSGSHFMMESTPLKKRLIRKAVLGIKGTLHGIEEKHISSVLELFQNGRTGSTLDLPGGIIARVSYDELSIERSRSAREVLPEVRITLGDNMITEWGLLIKVENTERAETDGRGKFTVTIDGDKLEGTMILRQRRDGDRFSPVGLIGSKKLKDYFIDRKVPRDQRDTIPIISDSKGIVWVAGHSVDKRVAADVKTINHLRLTINKIK